jgi:hypothetical protein
MDELCSISPSYVEFTIPKRSGGQRRIAAPNSELKIFQRRILNRLLRGLATHPAAMGFEKGVSIVANAACHVGKAVVVRMDVKDFFPSITEERVTAYFRTIGWDRDAATMLTRLTTYRGCLPQGSPTSPRLSNLVNYHLDARLEGLARKFAASYSRYADDITFSFPQDEPSAIHAVIGMTKVILAGEGYVLHQDAPKKLQIRRQSDRQLVTGLVVNAKGAHPALPRRVRRRLRAIEHHLATGRPITLGPEQLAGWRSLQTMIARQRADLLAAPGKEDSPPRHQGHQEGEEEIPLKNKRRED